MTTQPSYVDTVGRPAPHTGPDNHDNADPQPYPVKAPSVWPVAVVTLFLGLLGIIPAVLQSKKARTVGVSGARYWATFAGAAGAILAVVIISIAVSAGSAGTADGTDGADSVPVVTAEQLQAALVKTDAWKNEAGESKTATVATWRRG